MYVNEYFKRMRVFIVSQAVFGLLANMLIMIEPHAAIPRDYHAVLIPGDRIQRWYRPRENHYKFERMFVIRRDHPYDQYSSLKLFWPEDTSPYYNRDRITFYNCINRTPTTAKTLMHIIRGGTGTRELVVDVMYAPVRYRLMNRVIITCHIYTERNDSLVNGRKGQWDLFHTEKDKTSRIMMNNDQIKPAEDQSQMENSTASTMAVSLGTTIFIQRSSTIALKRTTQRTTSSRATFKGTRKKPGKPAKKSNESGSKNKGTTKQSSVEKIVSGNVTTPRANKKRTESKGTTNKTDKTNTNINKTTQKPVERILRGDKVRQGITKMSFHTTKRTSKTISSKQSTKGNLDTGTTNSKTRKMPLDIMSPKTVEVTSKKRVISSKIDKTTTRMGCNCSKAEDPIKTPLGIMNLGTEERNSTSTGTNLTTTSKYSQRRLMDKFNLSTERTSPKLKTTTAEVTLQKSKSTSVVTKIIEERIAVACGEINLGSNDVKDSKDDQINVTNFRRAEISRIKTDELTTKKSTSDQLYENNVSTNGKKSSSIEDSIQKRSTSFLYNLVSKTMKKKKIGLAKISY